MAYRHDNREFEINEDQIADFLQNAVEKVRTSEDVDVLAQLSKLFKKNVSLTVRKYVIALMLKESLKHYRYFGNNRRNDKFLRGERAERNDRRENRSRTEYKPSYRQEAAEADGSAEQTEERPRHPRVEIPESEAISIFISIGKNRRVYPRDLVGILIAIAGLDRERIGDIKVLANYSFVQLYKDDAQQAIDKLNGYDYRGRKLAVSYSRQRAEGDDSESEGSYEDDAGSETVSDKIDSGYEAPVSMTEQDMAAEDAAALRAAEKAAADKEPFGQNA